MDPSPPGSFGLAPMDLMANNFYYVVEVSESDELALSREHSQDIVRSAEPDWTPPGLREAPDTCHICMEKLGEDTLLTPCGHLYCRPCINQWHRTGMTTRQPVLCPDCRRQLWPIERPVLDEPASEEEFEMEPEEENESEEEVEPMSEAVRSHVHDHHLNHIAGQAADVPNWASVIIILEHSDIVNGTFAESIGMSSEGLSREISYAVHYLLNGCPITALSAPAELSRSRAFIDARVFAALLATAYEARVPSMRVHGPTVDFETPPSSPAHNLRTYWTMIVDSMVSILRSEHSRVLSAGALLDHLEERLLSRCDPHVIRPFIHCEVDSACCNMLEELMHYIVGRSVSRRVGRICHRLVNIDEM
ncbi:hypothetical protein AMS68_005441 [Peltaster fructicola]|uniref:RING-type domain-containing protein n=1 Tax=Peltaster fructicola TaxID=286661 RepID=A0A6H0XYU9_9PEZI|nr:hypothetical protein AMS68_005441 [Peltaster fructicola]